VLSTRPAGVPSHPGQGERILRGGSKFRILPFLGPAFIAAVAYIDPGNFATNIAGGSKFGYTLVWVIVASNLMAMLIQTLSAKLGIATGKNLPEVCRESFSRRTSILLWIQAEVIAMATDLAEFLGAALGFNLLFGIDLFPAAILTAVAAFAILGLQRFGFRPLEATIAAMVGVIGLCYVIELFYANPPLLTVAKHAVVPQFQGTESILLAVGILGATVMPHVIYLHSSLTQSRIVPETDAEAKKLLRYTRIDVIVAMSIAGLINMAMLVMAASVFFRSGLLHVESLENAHRTLGRLLKRSKQAVVCKEGVNGGTRWFPHFYQRYQRASAPRAKKPISQRARTIAATIQRNFTAKPIPKRTIASNSTSSNASIFDLPSPAWFPRRRASNAPYRYPSGSTGAPLTRTSKWRWGPKQWPVQPT
jgi:NRAMP (natural resistance-associated macrophage protein)-like metal ion transporter